MHYIQWFVVLEHFCFQECMREKEGQFCIVIWVCGCNINVKCFKWRRCLTHPGAISWIIVYPLGSCLVIALKKKKKGNWVLTTLGRRHIHNPLSLWYLITSGLYVAYPQKTEPVWIYQLSKSIGIQCNNPCKVWQTISSLEVLIVVAWELVNKTVPGNLLKTCAPGNCAKSPNQIRACCFQKALTIFVCSIHQVYNNCLWTFFLSL